MAELRRREPPYDDEPAGTRLGRIQISPIGVVLAVALIGSIIYVIYAITVRDASQIPLLASGAVVLGLVFSAVAILGLIGIWRSSVRGADGRAFGHAIVGGVASLIALGCFAAAIIMAMVIQTPS
jgi:hypothetical protein